MNAEDLYRGADREVQIESVLFALGSIGFSFGLGIGLAVAGILVLGAVGLTQQTAPTVFSVTTTVLQYVGFLAVVAGYVHLNDDLELLNYRVPTIGDWAWMAGGFGALFVGNIAVGAVARALGAESAQNQVIVQGQQNPELFLYMIPVAILFVGPGEELVFRGVVQGLLRRAFGPVVAVFGASVLFGAVHVGALIGTGTGIAVYVAVTTILGLVLGIIYERTGNIVVPVLVHGAYNALLFAGQWAVTVYDIPVQQAARAVELGVLAAPV